MMVRQSFKRRLANTAAIVGVLLLVTPPALAAYPVIDAQAIAQLKEQLSAAQKQIEKLTEQIEFLDTISNTVQKQIDAIGEVGRITLPMVNIGRLSSQVLRDAQCLKPDLEKMMPSLDFDNLNFDSVCGGREVYDEALFLDPEAEGWTDPEAAEVGYTDAATWAAQKAARRAVEARRAALTKDVVTSGLAQADLAATQTAKANEAAIEDLQTAASGAERMQDRLAVIAQGQVLTNRQLVQQNQLLAQLVKIQSTMLMQMVPAKDRAATADTVGGVE